MSDSEIDLLKKALERQKKARAQAEKILEEKSKELYDLSQHLKRTNSQLNDLLDEKSDEVDGAFLNIIDPYVVMDLSANVIKTNDSAKEFLEYDYTKESLNLTSLVHSDFFQYTLESMQSLIEVGMLKNYRAKIFTKSGQEKFVQINASLIYDKQGNPFAAQGIIRDITQEMEIEEFIKEQRKQKEELLKKLAESNKGLQEYAHIVSHDLKSPLRSISALATWLQEDYKDKLDEGGKQNLALMQDKIASMDKLISGILEYSTANSSNLNNKEVDLNQVIAEIKKTIFVPEHVKVEIPVALPTIIADKTKLHQLFQNFLSNAVVHIEREKGLVQVLFKEEKDHWQFTVSDNGVGIPKEYHKKIFEIFQSIGHNERSTGIGLSIVKKIVDRYEGEVWVDSEEGEGTDFHFTLSKDTLVKNQPS